MYSFMTKKGSSTMSPVMTKKGGDKVGFFS